jgi:uncharacterized protein (DUF1015 family)
MRFLLKAEIPTDAGNKAIKEGKLGKILEEISKELKPEYTFFAATDGHRTSYMIVNLNDASQIPAAAEPFFLALGAKVELEPVMLTEDLMKSMPAIEKAVKNYG